MQRSKKECRGLLDGKLLGYFIDHTVLEHSESWAFFPAAFETNRFLILTKGWKVFQVTSKVLFLKVLD